MADTFTLDTDQLGAIPIIDVFIDRLGLKRLLEVFVPHGSCQPRVAGFFQVSV